MLLLKAKGGREPHIIHPENIQRISFGYAQSTLDRLFGKSFRRITIIAKGLGTIYFDEPRHKEFFETYLQDLQPYAVRNRITFYNFPDKD